MADLPDADPIGVIVLPNKSLEQTQAASREWGGAWASPLSRSSDSVALLSSALACL
jgi:hypothetical protein